MGNLDQVSDALQKWADSGDAGGLDKVRENLGEELFSQYNGDVPIQYLQKFNDTGMEHIKSMFPEGHGSFIKIPNNTKFQ